MQEEQTREPVTPVTPPTAKPEPQPAYTRSPKVVQNYNFVLLTFVYFLSL